MILTQKIKKALFYKAFRRRSVYSTVKNPGSCDKDLVLMQNEPPGAFGANKACLKDDFIGF
jgi:hypothetical protein